MNVRSIDNTKWFYYTRQCIKEVDGLNCKYCWHCVRKGSEKGKYDDIVI